MKKVLEKQEAVENDRSRGDVFIIWTNHIMRMLKLRWFEMISFIFQVLEGKLSGRRSMIVWS